MHTFSQIFTFLKVYFGDSLARLLALFCRGNLPKTTDSSSAGDLSSDSEPESAASDGPDKCSDEVPDPSIASPEPECTTDNEPTAEDLLRAAVISNLDTLPSLPSLFKFPKPRPPIDMPVSAPSKQDFGPPSGLYYDRRLPFGDATNFRDFELAKGMKLNTDVKPRKMVKSKFKAAARAPRSHSKGARRVQFAADLIPGMPLRVPPAAAVVVESVPSAHPPPVVASPQPAPGSDEWNTAKAAVLAQARKWSDQVQTSRRHSLPVPPPLPLDIPVLIRDKPCKRHSAPPALVPVPASKTRRPNLDDRLSALFKQAQDTIVALREEKTAKDEGVVGRKRSNDVKYGGEFRNFSARALEEGQEIFIIGEDDEDEAEILATTSRQEQDHNYSLPTVNPATWTPGLVSSTSPSRSMAAFASSRSLSDLLDSFDAVMTGPSWRRIISRSSDLSRRNDSVV
ncbi:hypothetical protein K438DRAFT_1797008 [Mycena galopus ATCC 62051]|nr:hypothetical protein K438DRAFT_1797008 [Mycena galopus ATCC 62051]